VDRNSEVAQEVSVFFSEEKKQKTFASAIADGYGTWPDGWVVLKEIKVFCFFSQDEEDLPCFAGSRRTGVGGRRGASSDHKGSPVG
jgi:hypothetical protein